MKKTIVGVLLLSFFSVTQAQLTTTINQPWVADKGDGTYQNPVLHADYSDPDAIRVGNDYYLVASSFNFVPGLPILHSKDLVNWTLIGHALGKQPPFERFQHVQPGGGVWAPAIRYHNNEFYIYYPDPDEGIYVVKAKNPAGPWSAPIMVKKAKGWIDPCPFWDEDGKAYLVNGMAGSRSGIKSCLIMNRMNAEGTALLDDGAIVFDGHEKHPTIEGPKMYKRNGYYYLLAPAGGVGKGWQLALRSKNIYGPYEEKIVLEQGTSPINGPHQGGLVTTPLGESWFLHFQDKDAYGRILHLQPVKWVNDWPLMGEDKDGNGIGEPVLTYTKPKVTTSVAKAVPATSDEFNDSQLGLQWQFGANRQSNFCFPAGKAYGFLRLFNLPMADTAKNLWLVPNIVSQKFPAPNFTATTKLTFTPRTNDEEVGLMITGIDYSYLSVKQTANGLVIGQTICIDAEHGQPEQKLSTVALKNATVYLRVVVQNVLPSDTDYKQLNKAENSDYGNARCQFSYSTNGTDFSPIGVIFGAKKGKWVGSNIGLFAIRKGKTYETGYADFDWFRMSK